MKDRIVEAEVAELINCAFALHERYPEVSARILEVAWKIVLAANAKTPKILRMVTCGHCKSLLVQGRTARVRLIGGSVIWYCLRCGEENRIRRYA